MPRTTLGFSSATRSARTRNSAASRHSAISGRFARTRQTVEITVSAEGTVSVRIPAERKRAGSGYGGVVFGIIATRIRRKEAAMAERKKLKVYLESSFVSYLTGRETDDAKIAADQAHTRRWMREQADLCELKIS